MAEAIVVAVLAVVAAIVWFVRLEGRLNQVQKETDKLTIKVENIDSALVSELTQIKVALAEIKGAIGHMKTKPSRDVEY